MASDDSADGKSSTRPLPTPVDHTELEPAEDAGTDTSERRRYIEIRPTDTPVSPRAVGQAMEQLHAMLNNAAETRWRDRLTGAPNPPSVERLLVGDGAADTSIRYPVGATNDLHDELERILRMAVPSTYELRTVSWHPRDITGLALTPSLTDLYEPTTQSAPDDDPPIMGVQFYGEGGPCV